ncbi:LysM peptidoglycan-binding domain-containing protein [Maribacter sp. MMG018]|uniref:amino acid ABC transporter substrate-binding protein n=1 Tax=Maribacter sp. MMG018 TaxID=2822688 RepID=UPI001B36739D|nr:LysM peptidoglycan-binding domain-containing protein [Maribacter sp. MMG018]MBQ4914464.1 LysM peptidoglycan-binding domain-containing protein [Maribacter sp. MMG018]
MKNLIRLFFTVCLFLFFSGKAFGQKFTTHAVKKNETLYSIAKQYGVSQDDILKYNKEIKKGGSLNVNTILVIPSANGAVAKPEQQTGNNVSGESVEGLIGKIMNDSVVKKEPIGFVEYKVKKKETLYGIAKKFDVTEEEIKKYNKELYATQLKKKMVIRIPKYRKTEEDQNVVDPDDYEKYVVAPKETRWSIAHKYGITVDSMLVLNPGLSKTTNYLQEGYELLMPKIPGSSVKNQETQLYRSYTVPAKMNFYRLEQQFGVKADEIVRLNPEITERGGLKEGMVIRLPETKLDPGVINTDNYIFYEVKPKQNEFRLTRKFGMSWADLVKLNPALKDGLKAGMVLKLPKDQVGDFEVKNSLVLDKINLLDSINVENRPKVMFMLPFRLDKLDLNDTETVEWTIANRNSLKYSLGLYSGALVALDSIKSLGVSVDVKTFDNQLDLQKTKEILQKENLGSYSAILGPLDVQSLKEVSNQAANYQVPVIAPVPAKSDISLGNVFFSYTEPKTLREHMLKYVKEKYTNENIVVIADEKNAETKAIILENFAGAKALEVKEEKKNIGISRDKLAGLLSEDVENWVFVESDNFKLISSLVSILNAFNNSLLDIENGTKKLKVRMFTTDKNNAFDNDVISSTHLSNLHFTYPSVYREVSSGPFVRRYKEKFGDAPDKFAVRGFDITYDLLLKLAYKNDLLSVSKFIGETEYSGNKFDYEKDISSGYFNKASYIMGYDNMWIKELD